jgi:hypothetical protein
MSARTWIVRLLGGWSLLAALVVGAGPGPARAAVEAAGSVNSPAGLNLRVGPGLGYRVLLVLEHGQDLLLVGRSTDGLWLEAALPESGLGGWVYAALVKTATPIDSLPVTQAAGGPADERPPAAAGYRVYVVIADNRAVVYLQNFPASQAVVIRLGRSGGAAELKTAEGRTGADGAATLRFDMPAAWADGKPVTERTLTLEAATADGSFRQTVSVLYVR